VSPLPVSIVIPVLNEGKALIETINSIETAADLPREIVVVDDGSTDGCCEELRDGSYKRSMDIVLVTQKRCGVAGARNVGASIARQPFIVFLDAHCCVQSGWLSNLMNVIEKRDHSVACPAIRDRSEPHYVGCGATLVGRGLRYRWIPVQGERPTEVGIIPGGCMALSRELFEGLGKFDGMKHYGFEDVEFCFRAWRLGAVLLAVPTARIEHLFRGGQPFEVPQASFIYNAARTAVLHLAGERLKATLDALSMHPDFTNQIIELFAGDIFERKSLIGARVCKNMEEYFEAFPIQ
jgi:GT2 family glycosyltransferase